MNSNNSKLIAGIALAVVVIAAAVWFGSTGGDGSARNRETDQPFDALATIERLRSDDRVPKDVVVTLELIRNDVINQAEAQANLQRELAAVQSQLAELVDPEGGFDAQEPTAEDETPQQRSINRLVDAGFSESDADAIVREADAAALATLDLRFEAERDGWLDSSEYAEQQAALPTVSTFVRDTYGDDAYDRYLFAVDRPNRVVVRNVLMGSAAASAEIAIGDRVIELDGNRVFHNRDINRIMTSDTGDTVPIIIERDGESIEAVVTRGPLGVNMYMISVDPQIEDEVADAVP